MRAIDTNGLVRLIVRDDAKQAAAAESFVAGGCWVSHLVLAEVVWVLDSVYELESGRIATAVEMLLNHSDLFVQDPETVAAALSQYRQKPGLGFSDCLILETARRAGFVPLGTFDRALGRLKGAQLLSG